MIEFNKIYQGDVLEVLKSWPDEFIDCIITSPPYYGLRDYGTAEWKGGSEKCDHIERMARNDVTPERLAERAKQYGAGTGDGSKVSAIQFRNVCLKCGAKSIDRQIGLEKTLKEYLDKILLVTAELKRVLKPSGTMFWNHGDSYGNTSTTRSKPGGIVKHQAGIRLGGGPEKSLLLQAHRLAIRMVDEQKWILRNTIIWHKPNVMPSSVKDRFTVDYEPVFFFTKNKSYWFETQYEPHIAGEHRGGGIKMKELGQSLDKWTINPLGRNKRSVWKIPTHPYSEAHFATFPEDLIVTPIRAGCPEMICKKCGMAREKIFKASGGTIGKGWHDHSDDKKKGMLGRGGIPPSDDYKVDFLGYTDCGCNAGWDKGIVLDPFLGSGTTALVARSLGRNYLGIELNKDYIKLAEKRLAQQVLL